MMNLSHYYLVCVLSDFVGSKRSLLLVAAVAVDIVGDGRVNVTEAVIESGIDDDCCVVSVDDVDADCH